MPRRSVRGYLRRHWLVVGLGIWVVFSEALILTQFPIDRPNVGETPQDAGQSQKAGRYVPPLRASWVPIRARLLRALDINLSFIDRYHDTLNAVSTLAVAIFTATLWATTKRLYRSGEHQIQIARESADLTRFALESAETPYLVVIVTKFVQGEDVAPGSDAIISLGSYCFENCGRSPAIILESRIDKFANDCTPDPVYWPFLNNNTYHTSTLPNGRKSDRVYITQGMFDGWTAADSDRVAWVNGAVRYADVFGNQFITGFLFYRNALSGNWIGYGSTTNNFRRKLTGDDLRRAKQRDSLTGPGAGLGFGDPETDA